MKLGILISSMLVVIIIIVVLVTSRGVPQRPTYLTSEYMLAKHMPKLPEVYTPGGGDASDELQELWNYYKEYRTQIATDDVSKEVAEKCMDLYIKVLEGGELDGQFLDDTCPIEPRAYPSFEDAMTMTADAAMRRAFQMYQKDEQKERREKAALAVWAVGHQMFTKAKRLPVRVQGLEIMKFGATEMFNWSKDGSELDADMQQVEQEINKFERDYWRPKNNLVYDLEPNVGDILKMCYDDEDISFRVEAVLCLGWVKWNPRTRGNDTAVKNALKKLQDDPNSMVRKAAEAAEALTVEELRRLN